MLPSNLKPLLGGGLIGYYRRLALVLHDILGLGNTTGRPSPVETYSPWQSSIESTAFRRDGLYYAMRKLGITVFALYICAYHLR